MVGGYEFLGYNQIPCTPPTSDSDGVLCTCGGTLNSVSVCGDTGLAVMGSLFSKARQKRLFNIRGSSALGIVGAAVTNTGRGAFDARERLRVVGDASHKNGLAFAGYLFNSGRDALAAISGGLAFDCYLLPMRGTKSNGVAARGPHFEGTSHDSCRLNKCSPTGGTNGGTILRNLSMSATASLSNGPHVCGNIISLNYCRDIIGPAVLELR